MPKTLKLFGKVVRGSDLFSLCHSLPQMIERVEELRVELLEAQEDGIELLDPVVTDGCLLVTSNPWLAEKHLMYQKLELEADTQ